MKPPPPKKTSLLAPPPPPPPLPPPSLSMMSKKSQRIDTGLSALREAGYVVVTQKNMTSVEDQMAAATAAKKKEQRLDTGLDKLQQSGYTVVRARPKTVGGNIISSTSYVPETSEQIATREKEASRRADEAAKRVRQHAINVKRKEKEQMEKYSPSGGGAAKNRVEERQAAEKEKKLQRARIYAMNCLMESFRQVQIREYNKSKKEDKEEEEEEEEKETPVAAVAAVAAVEAAVEAATTSE